MTQPTPSRLAAKAIALALALGAPLGAPAADEHAAHHATVPQATADAAEVIDGEVRKIDKEAGKITLKHGPMKALDMPGMTMVFEVKNKAMLDRLQAGNKVKFKATRESGKFIVTEIYVME